MQILVTLHLTLTTTRPLIALSLSLPLTSTLTTSPRAREPTHQLPDRCVVAAGAAGLPADRRGGAVRRRVLQRDAGQFQGPEAVVPLQGRARHGPVGEAPRAQQLPGDAERLSRSQHTW